MSTPAQFKKTPLTRREEEENQQREAAALAEKFAALNKEDYVGLADSPRRRAREAALLLFYQMEMGGEDWELAQQVFADVALAEEHREFAAGLARNAAEDKPRSDALIGKYAREWSIDRFASVDRCVLRLAVSELLRDEDNERAIIINEAIELAKKFGDENSGPFVNGILDAIRAHEFPSAEEEPQPAEEAAPPPEAEAQPEDRP